MQSWGSAQPHSTPRAPPAHTRLSAALTPSHSPSSDPTEPSHRPTHLPLKLAPQGQRHPWRRSLLCFFLSGPLPPQGVVSPLSLSDQVSSLSAPSRWWSSGFCDLSYLSVFRLLLKSSTPASITTYRMLCLPTLQTVLPSIQQQSMGLSIGPSQQS